MAEKVDVFLEHFGVKGMHWGKHTGGSSSSSTSSTRSVRKQEKVAKREQQEKEILSARERLAKKDSKLAALAVKSVDHKTELGRKKANDAFNKLAEEYDNDPDHVTAAQQTGKERVRSNMSLAGWGVTVVALAALSSGIKHL